ncbi:unnamed protein product [Eretmochelys imbricata]
MVISVFESCPNVGALMAKVVVPVSAIHVSFALFQESLRHGPALKSQSHSPLQAIRLNTVEASEMKTPERTELTKAWCPNRELLQLIRVDKRTDLLIAKAEVTSVNPHASVHKLLTAEIRKDMILPLCSIAPLARCPMLFSL